MLYLLKTLFFIDVLMVIGLLLFRWALLPPNRSLVSGKLFALALLTPVVALFCGNLYLFCLYLVLVVAFNSRSRTELAGVYLFLLPLMPILSTETGVGGIYLLVVSIVSATGLGALIGVLTTGGRRAATLLRYDLAMWTLVVLFVFMYNRYGNPTVLLRGTVTYLLAFVGPFLLVSRAGRSPADVERMLLRLSLGATLVAVTALFQASRNWILFETYYSALHVRLPITTAYLSMRGGLLRSSGSMGDYSSAGLFLAIAVTLLPLLRRHFRPAGFWVVMAVSVGGLFVTQSRGGWVAAIVGLLFIAAWRGKWGRLLLLAGAAAAGQGAVLAAGKTSRLAQLAGQSDAASGTVDYRQRLLTQGLEQVRSHPLFGQPPEQVVSALSDLRQGEQIVDFVNSHLFVAMVAGIPLFLLWCSIFLMPVVDGWRQRRDRSLLAAVPAAIIVPDMVALLFTSQGDRNLTWLLIALGLAGPCLIFARGTAARRSSIEPVAVQPVGPVPSS